jgi:hypothetical protein
VPVYQSANKRRVDKLNPNNNYRQHPKTLIKADGLAYNVIRMSEEDIKEKNVKMAKEMKKRFRSRTIVLAMLMGDRYSHLKNL